MKVLPSLLVLVSMAALFLPAQEPAKPAPAPQEVPAKETTAAKPEAAAARQEATAENATAKVAAIQKTLQEIAPYGKSAEKPLKKARQNVKVKTTKPVLQYLFKELAKVEPKDKAPEDGDAKTKYEQGVAALANALAEQLSDLVRMGTVAAPVVESAKASATGLEQEVWKRVDNQLYVQLAYEEVASYLEGNRASGTFDGMFPRTAGLGRKGADAMLALFSDLEHTTEFRSLAGEGVAQLGNKDDVPKVKAIYDEDLEEAPIKAAAKKVMARLGDRTEFDKDLNAIKGQLKDATEKQAKEQEKLNDLIVKVRELNAAQSRTPEQEEELKKLQKEGGQIERAYVEATGRLGQLHGAMAELYLGIRDNVEAEGEYKAALNAYGRIANYLQRNPGTRGSVAISYYNLACVQSLQNKVDDALKAMDRAFYWGYDDFGWASKDGDLANLRKNEKFGELMAEVKAGKAKERWKTEDEERQKKREAEAKKADTSGGS